jgi:CDGSH-type Zn-finger protein/uncharacterized Fe-S cluster protein YjdI
MSDRLHEFGNDAITVTWSKARCIHAAECVRGLPAVFQPGTRPWVKVEAAEVERIAAVVERCPTGALHHTRHDGGPPEAVPATNTVRVSRHGPLVLRGDIEVVAPGGTTLLRDTRVALCRCGQSGNKPFCDNAHRTAGFRDEGAVRDEDSVQDPGAVSGVLRVLPHADGSLQLEGPFTLVGADGTTLAGTSSWLCRCGHSGGKPFCDGSHGPSGFRAEGIAGA